MLSHRERVLKTLEFEPTDRVAFDLMEGTVWPALAEYFQDAHGLSEIDAVYDFLIDRHAQGAGEGSPRRRIALESRACAGPECLLLGNNVQVGGRDAGPHVGPQLLEDFGHDGVRSPHDLDLAARFQNDHFFLPVHRVMSSKILSAPSRAPSSHRTLCSSEHTKRHLA